MLLALRKGEIDAIGDYNIQSSVPSLLMDENIEVAFHPAPTTDIMALNLRKAPFSILAFREAINIALDRQDMINTVLSGYGALPEMAPAIPSYAWDYNPDVKWPHTDYTKAERIVEANAILDDIPGMSTIGGDGLREYNGEKLIFSFVHDTGLKSTNAVSYISQNLAPLGMQFDSNAMSFGAAFGKVFRHGGADPLGWDAYFIWSVSLYDTYSYPAPAPLDEGGEWRGRLYASEAYGWTNTEAQSLMKQQATEMDPEIRLGMRKDAQELFAADLPVICLYHTIRMSVYRNDRFTGWLAEIGAPYNSGKLHWWGMDIWYGTSVHNAMNLEPI